MGGCTSLGEQPSTSRRIGVPHSEPTLHLESSGLSSTPCTTSPMDTPSCLLSSATAGNWAAFMFAALAGLAAAPPAGAA